MKKYKAIRKNPIYIIDILFLNMYGKLRIKRV